MQKSYLYFILVSAVLLTGAYGCKKVNGIDNNTAIETPYSLYFSDTAGTLFNSNDGLNYSVVFPSDGYEARSIITSGNNVLWSKVNIYVSTNNGVNFNQGYDSVQSMKRTACNGLALNLNQSMMIDIPSWNLIYSVTNLVHNIPTSVDYLGAVFSNNHGIRGSWGIEGSYDTSGRVGLLPVKMISYTFMPNGVLCGLALDPDSLHFRNFYKTCATCSWIEATAGFHGFLYTDTAGSTLPPNGTDVDSSGFYTLGHYNNRLIAIDQTCHNGAWYSDDTGRNWLQYQGLPLNTPLLCIASPFEQVCLIGTYGQGLYILNVNTGMWQPNNNGLGNGLIIRSITSKQNVYKNNTTKNYIYLATNLGIYQSTDNGANWIKTIAGNYVAIY